MDLLERLAECTPPNDAPTRAMLWGIHEQAVKRSSLQNGLATLAVISAGALGFSVPVLLPGIGAVAAGCAGLLAVRGLRRKAVVERWCRDAALFHARAVAPAWHCEECAVLHDHYEHFDAFGDPHFVIALPDDALARIPCVSITPGDVRTLYSPGSPIVIVFDRDGTPVVGSFEIRGVPRAQLRR